jgi:hypothetical protein
MDDTEGSTVEGQRPDDAASHYIAKRVTEGAPKKAIVQELIQRGYEPAKARDMVGGVARKQVLSTRQSGLLYLVVGIVITLFAIGVTISSYSGAAQQGGTYVICWGVALFGLLLAIRGIRQLVSGRRVK